MKSNILIAILFCLAHHAAAQITGSIFGTVLDSSGAAIPNRSVQAVETSTNVVAHAVTSNQGDYLFPALPPGSYRVEVSQAGWRPTSGGRICRARSPRWD